MVQLLRWQQNIEASVNLLYTSFIKQFIYLQQQCILTINTNSRLSISNFPMLKTKIKYFVPNVVTMANQMSNGQLSYIKTILKIYLSSLNVHMSNTFKSKLEKFAFQQIKNKNICNVPNFCYHGNKTSNRQ